MTSIYPSSGSPRGRPHSRGAYDMSMLGESSMAGSSSSRTPSSASKFMNNVKRSLSGGQVKKRAPTLADFGMHSTPEESLPPTPPSYTPSPRSRTPTIEEIAMGLHISRTPHFSPLQPHQPRSRPRNTMDYPMSPHSAPATRRSSFQLHRRKVSTPTLMPPPPLRSSMKKASTSPTSSGTRVIRSDTSPIPLTPSASDASLSSLPSSVPSTPRSNRSASASLFSAKLHSRMSKLLPLRRTNTSSTAVVTASDDDSASSGLTPRKVVRFSAVGDDT
ncbi:hypothetical protein BXZ70DRAFT_949428 [Cristinia sonorae]|uniref:Uncharacterized protein n=1 Tax=Cristinia sonorae TaxID=1940300 RepID=A0A8K0UI32_9AGAR|nr:hypothetical protein BXZ70DRAFT_949428 [Cristinia sonorae]